LKGHIHYKRREEQPTLAPPKSKEFVDFMLCGDPGDNDNEDVVRKRSRPIGQNTRLDRFKRNLKSHHPSDASRNGAESLFAMGLCRRAPYDVTVAPEEGQAQERMAYGSLVPRATGMSPHVVASTKLEDCSYNSWAGLFY